MSARATGARGYVPVLDRAAALAVLLSLPGRVLLRADGRRTRDAIVRALVERLDVATGLIVVTHAALAALASAIAGYPISRSTVGRHMQAIEADGGIRVQQRSQSAALSGSRNLAPVYAVMTPAPEVPAPPVDQPRAGGVCAARGLDGNHLYRDTPRGFDLNLFMSSSKARIRGAALHAYRREAEQPGRYVPARRGALRLRANLYVAEAVGVGPWPDVLAELPRLTRRFFDAGWCPDAVVHALLTGPDGTTYPNGGQPAHADRTGRRHWWRQFGGRLRRWRDDGGLPVAAPVAAVAVPRGRPSSAGAPVEAPGVPVRVPVVVDRRGGLPAGVPVSRIEAMRYVDAVGEQAAGPAPVADEDVRWPRATARPPVAAPVPREPSAAQLAARAAARAATEGNRHRLAPVSGAFDRLREATGGTG